MKHIDYIKQLEYHQRVGLVVACIMFCITGLMALFSSAAGLRTAETLIGIFNYALPVDYYHLKLKNVSAYISKYLIYISISFLLANATFSKAKNIVVALANIRATPYVISLLGVCLTSIVSCGVLKSFPNSGDEYAYLFQADTFYNGRLYFDTPDHEEFYAFNHIAMKDNKWASRFPPGWPIVIYAMRLIGLPPWCANPILSGLLLLAVIKLSNTILPKDNKLAMMVALLLMGTPYFIFNGASYFSHVLTSLCMVVFYIAGVNYAPDRPVYGVIAGFFVGLAFLARPYTAVVMSLPFAILFVARHGIKSIFRSFTFVAGYLPCLLLYMIYNHSITGDPLLPVTVWIDPNEGVGFVNGHSLAQGVKYTILRLKNFMIWTSPMMLIILFMAFAIAIRLRKVLCVTYIAVFFVLVGSFIFYWNFGGNQYGPRFYYESFPISLVGLCGIASYMNNKWRNIFHYLFMTTFIFSLIAMPTIVKNYSQVIMERNDIYSQVKARGIKNAIVFVGSSVSEKSPMSIGDLTRNMGSLKQDVLYVWHLGGDRNRILLNHYKSRDAYLYKRNAGQVRGRLEVYDRGVNE